MSQQQQQQQQRTLKIFMKSTVDGIDSRAALGKFNDVIQYIYVDYFIYFDNKLRLENFNASMSSNKRALICV